MPRKTATNPDRLVSLEEAEADFGLSTRQLTRWVHEGRLPYYKPAGPTGRIYLRRGDLVDFLAACRVPARNGPLAER